MSQITLNPYPDLGGQFTAGMASIIGAIPPTPSVVQFVNAVAAYVELAYYPPLTITPAQLVEVKSVAYHAINNYVNPCGNLSNYNGMQLNFIKILTGPSLYSQLTVDSISNRILDVEDNITKCNFGVDEQAPLFYATMIGVTAYNYWLAQIALGAGSPWLAYFNAAKVSPTGNVPYWTAASMEGALIGAKFSMRGMIDQTTQIVGLEIISALVAALTIAAGKVIFVWIPKVQQGGNGIGLPCNC
jgi:hypothetical protein